MIENESQSGKERKHQIGRRNIDPKVHNKERRKEERNYARGVCLGGGGGVDDVFWQTAEFASIITWGITRKTS